VLRALGQFLTSVGRKLLEWAELLSRCLTGLDTHCPTWRDLPEAKAA
jgi:hypothetical protein